MKQNQPLGRSPASDRPDHLYSAYIFDLDGTVYLGDALLPTAGETIQRLRALGKRTVFLSNNPTKTREAQAATLTTLGLPTPAEDVLNSALVMADFLRQRMPGARLYVIGEPPLEQVLRQAGFELSEDAAAVDAVIASFDRTFVYRKLQIAFDAIRAGARFFATNGDKYCPVPGGGQPDAAGADRRHRSLHRRQSRGHRRQALGAHGRRRPAACWTCPRAECLMTGDRLETDVLMGLDAGMAAALTLTGATSPAQAAASSIRPTYVISRLADLLPDHDS